MNKTIFFDVDNTLVCRSENKICDSTWDAINKLNKDNKTELVIATGRSLAMVKQEDFHHMFKTIISANGSLITRQDEIIYKQPMDRRLIEKLIRYFEEKNIPYCIHLLTESKGKLGQDWVHHFSKKYNMRIKPLEENILDCLDEYEIFQLNAHIKNEEIDQLKQSYPLFSFVKLIDIEEGYDIFNKNCSKGSAIKFLKEKNITKDITYYAFGDGFNDLEMFDEVDYSIAMGNGCDQLKKCATYITDSINQNGIYNALKKLNLIKEG